MLGLSFYHVGLSFYHAGGKMSITVTGNPLRMTRRINQVIGRQIPFAASKSLNETGKVLLSVNKREMRKQFDNPVRYTLNAFYMKPARKNNLVMSIRRKSKPSGKHYLEVQHKGGARPMKGVEKMMNAAIPYTGDLRAVIPTKRTKTASGGISMARVNEAIAGLGGKMPNSPYTQRGVERQEARMATRKKPVDYFIGYKSQGKNKTDGIYKREGGRVKKMFHLLEYRPTYQPNFPFFPPLIRNARSYLPGRMRKNLRFAIRTARF